MSELPEYFYIFCNFNNFITYHNYKTAKVFSSAAFTQAAFDEVFQKKYLAGTVDYLPYGIKARDLQTFSPFSINVINDFRVEHDAETIRSKYYPYSPSRLSAIYAFADMKSCESTATKYPGWDISNIKKFELIKTPLNRVAKVNMEVVSLARTAYQTSGLDEQTIETIWHHYWSGKENFTMSLPDKRGQQRVVNSGKIWEYLIEGSLRAV